MQVKGLDDNAWASRAYRLCVDVAVLRCCGVAGFLFCGSSLQNFSRAWRGSWCRHSQISEDSRPTP